MEKENLKSILVITIGFTIIGLFLRAVWPFYIVVVVGTASIISSQAASFINKAWYMLARILGFINSRILLTIIYYLFLLPLALLSRWTGKKSVILERNDSSYFTDRNHQYKKSDLENPW